MDITTQLNIKSYYYYWGQSSRSTLVLYVKKAIGHNADCSFSSMTSYVSCETRWT